MGFLGAAMRGIEIFMGITKMINDILGGGLLPSIF